MHKIYSIVSIPEAWALQLNKLSFLASGYFLKCVNFNKWPFKNGVSIKDPLLGMLQLTEGEWTDLSSINPDGDQEDIQNTEDYI